jgi:ACS family glucarate transporter-like MFS transporter
VTATLSRYRNRVLGLLFLLSSMTFLDRVCISVAGPRMQADLDMTPQMWGWVMGVFTLSYSLFEIPSGAMGDRFGPRKTLSRIVIWWSAFTTITGFVSSFRSLLIVRFLFGAGEAGAYPNSSAVVARWFPVAERARAQSIIWMAGLLGAGLTPMVVVPIQMRYGWRQSFLCFGGLGIVWAIVWYGWFRDNPTQKGGVSAAELAEIDAGPARVHVPLPWGAVLRTRNFWMIILSYFCYCCGSNFYLTWLHTYLQNGRHMSESQMAVASMFPFILGAITNLMWGWLGDALVRRHGLRIGRRTIGTIGLAAGGAFLMATVISPTNRLAVAFLTLAYCSMTSVLSSAWAVCLDVGRQWAGSLTGAMNTAGQLGALTSTVAFGYMVSYFRSYSTPLIPLATALLVGACFFYRIDPCEQIASERGGTATAYGTDQAEDEVATPHEGG